jgi:hypothetical protein
VPSADGASAVRAAAIAIGAPVPWQDFFVLVASRESKFHIAVGLGAKTNAPTWVEMHHSAGEASAALKAYDNNANDLIGCWPRAAYGFGSGGWYGMLPANALAAFESDATLRCLHPWTVFDPTISTIMAAWFARRLSRWKNWDGTVISLRVGWGNPSDMGDPAIRELKRDGYVQDCARAGLPHTILDSKLPDWKPAPAATLFDQLGADRGWLP